MFVSLAGSKNLVNVGLFPSMEIDVAPYCKVTSLEKKLGGGSISSPDLGGLYNAVDTDCFVYRLCPTAIELPMGRVVALMSSEIWLKLLSESVYLVRVFLEYLTFSRSLLSSLLGTVLILMRNQPV